MNTAATKETAIQRKVEMNQNADRKSEVYQKTLDLFVKKGYDATPMSMIAKTLGMSKGNLYYHFPRKGNIFFQTYLFFLQRYLIPILEQAEMVPDPAGRVAFFLRKFTLLSTSNRANRILFNDIGKLDKNHKAQIMLIWRRAFKIVRDSIEELQRSGIVHKFRGSLLTFMWFGMVASLVYWFDYSRKANAGELADAIAQTFLDSLMSEDPQVSEEVEKKVIREQRSRDDGTELRTGEGKNAV